MLGYQIAFDDADITKAIGRIKPSVIREPLGRALIKLIAIWERTTKGVTPVRTGNLRRSIQSEKSHAKDEKRPYVTVGTRTVYAPWIEWGETKKGKRMKVKPGGYRMFEQGQTAARDAHSAVMTTMGREIAERMAK